MIAMSDLPAGVQLEDVRRTIRKGNAEWTATPGAPLPVWAAEAIDHFFEKLFHALDSGLGPDDLKKLLVDGPVA